MAGKKGGVVQKVEQIATPIAQQLGLSIWNIEFVKEGASWFLRIYIDKEGGVSVDDCENFSRAIDAPLDEADPIAQNYYLEVSSPGIERELKKDWHFKMMAGRKIRIRLIRPLESGEKEIEGILKDYQGGTVSIDTGARLMEIRNTDASHIQLCDTEDYTGGNEEI